ncbi:Protein unc-13 homolog [Linum grandiflorum]
MASLFRDLSLGQSKRDSTPPPLVIQAPPSLIMSPRPIATDLESPLGQLASDLTDSQLRSTAYEIFLAVSRASSGKLLSSASDSPNHHSLSYSPTSSSNSNSSPSLQRSITSAAASKMKKALGLKSPGSGSKKSPGSGPGSGQGKFKKPLTVGELMRTQMQVSEIVDSRIRKALLRVATGQVGRRIETVVLPLELLQQLKTSDFTDHQEFESWQKRALKVLEIGLLLHPRVPLDKSNPTAQRLRQIIHGAQNRSLETGRNNESMQVLRSSVMSLASRSDGSVVDMSHWADGIPFNLRLYEMLLEACFDVNDDTSMIDEVDDLMEYIKKTWTILGINQMLHNLFAKDAKTTKDSEYSKVLSSTLTAILGWAEKRLLAYHDTFDSAAKILVEDISNEYRRRRKNEVDVARSRVDTYIRSSLRTAFAQANSSRRASKNHRNNLPLLAILAKDVGELAVKEKRVFSPILKRWHPFAAGLAVATLHACYGNELKQFISGITELTPDAVKVLRAADKLEKDLVQIAVEDSVDSDDGGKAIIREMPPFEAEAAIANLVKIWIKSRLDRVKEWIDRNIQQEVWDLQASPEGFAPSGVEVLRIMDEALDAYFQLPIPMHPALLPDLMTGLDRCLQYYATKAKSGCGSRNTYVPTMPALTRCETGSRLWKKKEKSINGMKRTNPQVATVNGDGSFGVPQLCLRISTLHRIRSELEGIEKRIITHLRNSESAEVEDFSNGLTKKFELTPDACVKGVQQLSEALGYRVVFHDLSNVLWDGLYVGEPSASRIEPFLQELERTLTIISDTINDRVRTRVITDIMRASFDGFLLVLLAGGPYRAFSRQDSAIIEEDFKSLKDLFWANGDGIPSELIDKFSATVRGVLPLFRMDTESLVERFRRETLEAYGAAARSKLPLPPTSGQWDPTEPNTLLRVLCYRNDEAATRFLKKTYNLPKKL